MSGQVEILAKLGVRVPEILLPAAGVDMAKWAVVACDQYSSERDYWEKAALAVGDAPSTLKLIYPEAYLEDGDKADRVARIQVSMRDYLARGILESRGECLVLVERYTPYEPKPRVGLMIAVDLEAYRYGKDSNSAIRPTEGTIVERLPPRMQIRRGAALELPHILLLVDDPGRTVIEPLYAARERFPKLYDFELMLGSGRVRGWKIAGGDALGGLAVAMTKLADPEAYSARYGKEDVLLFAVGDGNHSLATAKAIWEETKAAIPTGDPRLADHPARFALCELENIYDEGLPFHPIHRVLFGVEEKELMSSLCCTGDCRIERHPSAKSAFAAVDDSAATGEDCVRTRVCDGAHRVAFVSERGAGVLVFGEPTANLAAGTIQERLDSFLKDRPGVGIDYIHGSGSLEALASRPGNVGFYLPPVDKGNFFATVINDGVMPRKTFSMGEAPEKRFYVEARRITY
ncbi:MAG: DUF1015 domain-containing protein [Spirochaetaceae bacterium]|nr:DUF1015 domain-containing protein [Spirochaetaceae bacterium]